MDIDSNPGSTVPIMVPAQMLPLLVEAHEMGTLDFYNGPIEKNGRALLGRDCSILIGHREMIAVQLRWPDPRPWCRRLWAFLTRQPVPLPAPEPRLDFNDIDLE